MLMDQGLYELEELLNAAVSDLEVIDNTVKLLGRKFICDPDFLDFLTSLGGLRESSSPLFVVSSVQGEGKLGTKHVASIFKFLKVSPAYLLSWHASHIYSRAVNRRAFEDTPPEEIDGFAISEVKRAFGTQKDMQYLIDSKLRSVLLEAYKNSVGKSIVPRVDSDEFSTLTVFSDLQGRREEEIEFSTWLHAQPMHDISPEEQAAVEEAVASDLAEQEDSGEEEEATDSEGKPAESEAADQEAGAVDTDSGKPRSENGCAVYAPPTCALPSPCNPPFEAGQHSPQQRAGAFAALNVDGATPSQVAPPSLSVANPFQRATKRKAAHGPRNGIPPGRRSGKSETATR